MVISYQKLWVLLQNRNIKKYDFAEAVGISSRTLAKLSKNESVTMDTLLRICDTLHCGLDEIVSLEEAVSYCSIYEAWKQSAVQIAEDDNTKTYSFSYGDKQFEAIVTKRNANKHSFLIVQNEEIYWHQYLVLHRTQPLPEVCFFGKILPRKDGVYRLFIVSGTPGRIDGLDDGIFRSVRHPGTSDFVHVMSMAAFKCFSLG